MALLRSCVCCSLLTGSFISGVYAVVVYVVAFAIELSWIIEAEVTLPVPAFVLCVGYFLTFIASLALIVGLTVKRNSYLFGWVILLSVFAFPEAGLVLFMSLHYWALAVICVHSQHALWREEKMVLRRIQDLNMATRLANAGVTGPVVGNNSISLHQKKNGVDYQNAGFVNSTEYINGIKAFDSIDGSTHIPMVTQDDIQIMGGMRRSASSGSQQQFGTWGGRRSRGTSSTPYLNQIQQSRQQLPFGGSLPEGGLPMASGDLMPPYHQQLTPLNNLRLAFLEMNIKGGMTPGMSSCEFDASTFQRMMLNSSSSSAHGGMATFPRVRSHADVFPVGPMRGWHMDGTAENSAPVAIGDYWHYPLPSRPISIGYMDYMHPDARAGVTTGWTGGVWEGDSGGSLREKRAMARGAVRRALSVGDLRVAASISGAPFPNPSTFPASSDGSRTSLGAESDDFHKYKDVAL
ncbi:uncharacterized protein LOC124153744 isoform X2 [Ischnura elegans]|uniref:uncharacterized protein LOC124153744 isoform X2 n=1 Tax=Ischnura elegans TaxID=197161 RepID=UPI001ED8A7FD|nr:uncharacterized protein LOC124153744 isoform X2 [Ischnura elegans]